MLNIGKNLNNKWVQFVEKNKKIQVDMSDEQTANKAHFDKPILVG